MRLLTKLSALTVLLFSIGCNQKPEESAESPQEAMQKVAQAAGVDGFGSVESMSYTFIADLGDKQVVRSWTWLPKSNEVTLKGEAEAEDVRYLRSEVASDESGKLETIDQQFVNDLYWMIFPFQVVWDSSLSIEALPEEAAAVFPDAHAGLRVRYPEGVGYTPGDVYDLFYDENYQVSHWVFRKGGSEKPTRASEWEDYQSFGPLSISLNRTSPDSSFRIWFEDVEVELSE